MMYFKISRIIVCLCACTMSMGWVNCHLCALSA